MSATIPNAIPTTSAEITPEWITEALRSTGVATGRATGVDAAPVGVGVGLIGDLCRIRVEWADGTGPDCMIAKFPSAMGSSRFVATLLGMYRREVRFYQELSASTDLPHAGCYYAALDDDSQDFVLLMTDLSSGRTVDQIEGCSQADAELAIDRLAQFHAGWWNDEALTTTGWLPRLCDSPLPEAVGFSFQQGWGPVQELFPGRIPDSVRVFGDRYADELAGLLLALSEPPFTLSHGDYRVDNMFFYDDQRDLAVCDWQLIDRSRGGRDLTYFLTQSLTPADRAKWERGLVERYVAGLQDLGVSDYGFDAAWTDYRIACLFGLAYPVVAGGGLEHADVRATNLTGAMLDRSVAAIVELDCLELLDG